MKEGTVVQWFKKEGDMVEKGEPLVEVLSEKATYEVEAPASGVLRKILAEEGTDVPVAGTLAIITALDEELPEIEVAVAPPAVEAGKAVAVPERKVEERVERRIIASPAAKRLAGEHGIDLTQIRGSGPGGRIVEEDVRRLIEELKIMPRVREVIPLTGIRKTAAERVSLSARTAPQSTITMEVDMSNAAELRGRVNVSYTDMLVKAVAKALTEHPIINSTLEKEQIKIFANVNIGVAVATEMGLIVPVVRNANEKSLTKISSTLKGLVEKAKQSRLTKEELTGGTFTITNLGMYGVDVFTPIINPPQTAILGVGRVAEKPMVVEEQMVVRSIIQLSLTFDHRVVDGAQAAEFLQKVKQNLESPETLLA
ncbi:MAG: branched-chain alpha-keto acid dehydrogenase subunit E2 [Candidatus Bathyarchaeota archaeon BA2]|nr:MAG: branched-chain alpha-keto acid dehydrogenase subunit E2 [Candidatus Bathyarchaeota archaeon BA2]